MIFFIVVYCKLNKIKTRLNVFFSIFSELYYFSCKVKSVHWTIPYCCFNFKLSSVITFTLCRKIIALTQLLLKLQEQICEGKENIVIPYYYDLVLNPNITILTALWLYIHVDICIVHQGFEWCSTFSIFPEYNWIITSHSTTCKCFNRNSCIGKVFIIAKIEIFYVI